MTKTKTTILERLAKNSFPMNKLYEAKKNGYLAPLAELILASEQVALQAQEAWEFKSLAQMGMEQFIMSGNIYEFDQWEKHASRAFAECVSNHIYYEDGEGLLFFVQDHDGKYRVAQEGDAAYTFVRQLNSHDSVSDLRFTKPPTWAEELFLGRENWESYKLMWHDNSGLADPLYEASKKLRADAVIHETWRRMKSIPGLFRDENMIVAPTEKPLTTTERNTLLTIIAALCDYSAIKHQERGAASQIAGMTQELGAPVTDDTIRKVLAKIPEATEARMK